MKVGTTLLSDLCYLTSVDWDKSVFLEDIKIVLTLTAIS